MSIIWNDERGNDLNREIESWVEQKLDRAEAVLTATAWTLIALIFLGALVTIFAALAAR